MANITHGYPANDSKSMTYNRFDYYSGSQITVWFGDIMIDDIASIQWGRSQSKKPIYGYASQQFDAVAKGIVIIQGSFIVNFRQSGYLQAVINQITRLYGEARETGSWDTIRNVIGQHLKKGTFGPKTLEEISNIANSRDFLSLAKAYEDTIWGTGVPGVNEEDFIGPQLPGKQTPPDVFQHDKIPDGFTIMITYGNNSLNDSRRIEDYMQSTTKTLVGVHLMGESQVIQVGGQPAMEQYDFIARGTDENLGSSR